jgi:Zn finger protein HypA/HybF involved in hydrogenase expression
MACFPCKSTGKQKDKEGNEVVCPRCKGTGDAVKYDQRFYSTRKNMEVVNG